MNRATIPVRAHDTGRRGEPRSNTHRHHKSFVETSKNGSRRVFTGAWQTGLARGEKTQSSVVGRRSSVVGRRSCRSSTTTLTLSLSLSLSLSVDPDGRLILFDEESLTTQKKFANVVAAWLLPAGYPESCAPQLGPYMFWRGIQYFFGGALSVLNPRTHARTHALTRALLSLVARCSPGRCSRRAAS